MKRLLLLILGVSLAGLAWYLATTDGDSVDGLPHEPPAVGTPKTDLETGASTGGASASDAKPGADEGKRDLLAAARPRITGRCVEAETGGPIAGCEITVFDWQNWSPQLHGDSNTRRWECTTGVDGKFTCEVDGANSDGVTVRAEFKGRVMVLRSSIVVKSTELIDIGDIALQVGCKVHGLVVDSEGVPVTGFPLILSGVGWQRGESGRDGSISFPEVVAPGKWSLHNYRSWRKVVSETKFEITAGQRESVFRYVLEAVDAGKTISGTVVDAAGEPVEGYWLAGRTDSGRYFASGVSSKDGTFVLFSSTAKRGEVINLVSNDRMGRGLVGGKSRKVAWGTSGLRLVMKIRVAGRVDLKLVVRNGDTGQPVEGYRYRFYTHRSIYENLEPPRYTVGANIYGDGRQAGGEATIADVKPGAHLLSVLPMDNSLAPSGLEVVDVQGGSGETHSITLFRRRAVHVEVRSNAGTPVAGTKVQLILYEGPGEFRFGQLAFPVEAVYDNPRRGQGLVYSEGVTDAEGKMTLTGRPAEKPYLLRLMGPGHIPTVHRGVHLGMHPVTVRVRVTRGGSLIGRFRPLSAWQSYWPSEKELPTQVAARRRALPQIYLVETTKGSFWPSPQSPPFTFGRDTAVFSAAGVPPGRYRVRLICRRKGLGFAQDLGEEIVFSGEEERTVDIALEAVVGCKLKGRVFLNGAPLANANLYLRSPAPTWTNGYLDLPEDRRPQLLELIRRFGSTIRTDAEGRFPAITVMAGTYTVTMMGGQISPDAVRIAAGEEHDHVFHIRRVKLHVIARTATGELAAERRYVIEYKSKDGRFSHGSDAVTDGKGEITLDPAPSRVFYLTFYEGPKSRSATLRVGPLRAPLDRYEDTIDVRLPAPKSKDKEK